MQTDHHLDHNRLDCRCSSVAFCYTRGRKKQIREKIDHYQDLKSVEVQRSELQKYIPTVIGALGTVSKHLNGDQQ